jgi:hypothetical protein
LQRRFTVRTEHEGIDRNGRRPRKRESGPGTAKVRARGLNARSEEIEPRRTAERDLADLDRPTSGVDQLVVGCEWVAGLHWAAERVANLAERPAISWHEQKCDQSEANDDREDDENYVKAPHAPGCY